ncbi:MAG: hypothetical protein Q7U08_02700 [Flavobacteriaceae bacterium]|nr:hypothetical protein [Flavobacteriaceae bacterium]
MNTLKTYCNENNPETESRKLLQTPANFIPLLKLNGFELVLTTILQNYDKIDIQPPVISGHQIAFITILNIDDTNNLLAYYSKN